jgi:glycerol-3-phosphate dehydrogenase
MTIKQKVYDIFIIGGGINGVGIAADAASRGLSVYLAEQNDLASGTSSASSKLIHGGLRYLEYFEFHLVREALNERQILLEKAPYLVHPLEFIMPHNPQMRSRWLIRLGLFLYDHLAKTKRLTTSKAVNLNFDAKQNPLESQYQKGFSYMDCWVDDARLVVLNARLAKEYNAVILTRHRITGLVTSPTGWQITLINQETKQEQNVLARVLVNATGPWMNQVLKQFQLPSQYQVQLVKGSHIIVSKLYEGKEAYTLQNQDGRVIFAIPFHDKFTLIGTTDVIYQGDPQNAFISHDEINYLCDAINRYFKRKISPDDIIWQFSGVRALKHEKNKNPKALSRDYQIEFIYKNKLPLLNIIGGKITTHRCLAEHAIDKIRHLFPSCGASITNQLKLPGGDLESLELNLFLQNCHKQYPFLPNDLVRRYVCSYGSLIHELLSSVHSIHELGKDFSNGLYQREIDYLTQQEWAKTAEDILWRRTKLGLFFSDHEKKELEKFLKND